MQAITSLLDGVMEATVVPSFSRIGFEARKRLYGWRELGDLDLTGKVVLVTGANSGLGYEIAERVSALGASLRMLVRSNDKGAATVERIVAATGNEDIDYGIADMSELDTVRAFAADFATGHDRLDVLVHNAGAMFADRKENADGIEMTVAVHVVGPFLLTSLLLPQLEAATPSRVITMSSGGMYAEKLVVGRLESPGEYKPSVAYARAKRAQVVLNQQWAQRLGQRGVEFHAMHPGWADTPGVVDSLPGFHRIMGPILRQPAQGADTAVWLAAAPEPSRHNGAFWLDRRPRSTHKVPMTRAEPGEAERLWDRITTLAGIDPTSVRAASDGV